MRLASPTLPDNLRARADAEGPRIEKAELDGRTVWIKRSLTQAPSRWHRAQGLLSRIAPHPILRVTLDPGGPGSAGREARRIEAFRVAGFIVPRVLSVSDRALVLGDLGQTVEKRLRAGELDAGTTLRLAAETLGRAHGAGLVHGRPSLRDLTIDGERIGFIDFEEDPAAVMPLPAAQARDLWLFMIALARAGLGHDVLAACLSAYRPYLTQEHRAVLRPLVRAIAVADRVIGPLTAPFAGRDLKAPLAASRFLNGALG